MKGSKSGKSNLSRMIRELAASLVTTQPKMLTAIDRESVRNGTNTLSSRQIDRIIKMTRLQKAKPTRD